MTRRTVVTERDVLDAARSGRSEIRLTPGDIVTPLARDTARARGVALTVDLRAPSVSPAVEAGSRSGPFQKIAVGADARGARLKNRIVEFLRGAGKTVSDLGTERDTPGHAVAFGYAVARAVASGAADAGIAVDEDGIASAIAANKVPGVRAAACRDAAGARAARAKCDCNVLTLGAAFTADNLTFDIVEVFLATPRDAHAEDALRHLRDLEDPPAR